MRTVSKRSYEEVSEVLTQLLIDNADEGERISQQLFEFADAVVQSPSLSRALLDQSRDAADKDALLDRLVSKDQNPILFAILSAATQRRWAQGEDFVSAVNHLGYLAVVKQARAQGKLEYMQNELGALRNLLRQNRQFRMLLTGIELDSRVPLEQLVDKLLSNQLSEQTLRLFNRLLAVPLSPSLLADVDQLASLMAHERGARLVRVASATPLSDLQKQRLAVALNKKYGNVTLNVSVDPSLIGGLRIRVGNDSIDGTIKAELSDVRQRMGV
ncbi:ATP synthase F1 subunit delta [Boudabousia tangfeifanii]|uniref:ATP synthase subunit delta n=1 Tax=Boudabousia tangfeifanii TaxID=1912795 RepID=A0A1D9MJL9_9ACTO|nr:ATP synthase F1 subunit delta [Boudabousia tangfeifanii]AOZ72505.1 ATP synthase F1 subunit delta [Boudabousia tangfeifanii]